MAKCNHYTLEYTTRYVESLAQWDVHLLVDHAPRAFVLRGTEHAAREAGAEMVRDAIRNVEAGRKPTDPINVV